MTGTEELHMATAVKSSRTLSTRREKDTLGEVEVPADALWGAQTQRAIENYPISGYRAFPAFIRANQILGGALGTYEHVNPNDDVNMGQSTNDVTPTAMRLAHLELTKTVCEELDALAYAFASKATEYANVVKPGRTHLQDAVPITFGQEIGGWATRIRSASARLRGGHGPQRDTGRTEARVRAARDVVRRADHAGEGPLRVDAVDGALRPHLERH